MIVERPHQKLTDSLFARLGVSEAQMRRASREVTPYLILDGHRTGVEKMGVRGYQEGAIFSLKFASVLRQFGFSKVVYMIHTTRNRKTPERMQLIFEAIREVFPDFVKMAMDEDIRLKYHGKDIYTTYELKNEILRAEWETQHNAGIEVHYLTNYSEEWAINNPQELYRIPTINVAVRFTKGHLSGAYIPSRMEKAPFVYVQNASVVSKWSPMQLKALAIIIMRSYLENSGFIGSKMYQEEERALIMHKREEELFEESIDATDITNYPLKKKAVIFTPYGPVKILF